MYAKPFGTFQGRAAIQGFWADLIQKGAHDVQYRNVTFEEVDENTVRIGADWTMSIGGGVITRETWVKKGDRWLLADDAFQVWNEILSFFLISLIFEAIVCKGIFLEPLIAPC